MYIKLIKIGEAVRRSRPAALYCVIYLMYNVDTDNLALVDLI